MYAGVAVDVSLAIVAYDEQRVSLICTTRASRAHDHDLIINWRSSDYIGDRGEILQLTSTDPVNHTETSRRRSTTVATLLNTTRSNGVVTVVSELQFIASAQYSTSHVSCKANGRGPTETVTFRTIMRSPGKPLINYYVLLIYDPCRYNYNYGK